MKDYDNVILWLDYFNKNLSRNKGRKIQKNLAVYDPLISELSEAAISLGYDITKDNTNDNARYPRRPHVKSGYIMIPKINSNKNKIIKDISSKIINNRMKQKAR